MSALLVFFFNAVAASYNFWQYAATGSAVNLGCAVFSTLCTLLAGAMLVVERGRKP